MPDYSNLEGEETDDGDVIIYASENDDAWIRSTAARELSEAR